ncbi:uncharacterized protein LOC121687869 [Alosa sapidissima]|uniref:uncharacterized protein LOC121687869 n=1 Tax=Alosa sapidissima TaxID=34773 RepID=UPI001C08343B|nr:uncharacterized protein LOC121687869 [Alosa sapidissima]
MYEFAEKNPPPAEMETGYDMWFGTKEGRQVLKHLACVCLAILSFTASLGFISWAHGPSPPGMFETTKENMSNAFPIEVSMDRWAGYMDIAIPIFSMVVLYLSLFLVLKSNDFGPVCCNPEVHPPRFYLTWPVICVTHIGGLFLWDRGEILQALCLRMFPPMLGFYMLSVSYNNLQRYRPWLHTTSSKLAWFTYYATQNSLALSAWWSLIDALINLGVVLKYTVGLQDPIVSCVVLTLLFLAMLLWFILETFVFMNYIHYTFTVYPILIVGLGAMFTKGYVLLDMAPSTVYSGFLMLVATVMNCIMLCRHCCDSRLQSSDSTLKLALSRPEYCPSVSQSVDMLGMQGVQKVQKA